MSLMKRIAGLCFRCPTHSYSHIIIQFCNLRAFFPGSGPDPHLIACVSTGMLIGFIRNVYKLFTGFQAYSHSGVVHWIRMLEAAPGKACIVNGNGGQAMDRQEGIDPVPSIEQQDEAVLHATESEPKPFLLRDDGRDAGSRRNIARKPNLWKRVAAFVLVLALLAGSAVGASLFNRMNGELSRQLVLIGTLSLQLEDQGRALTQTEKALSQTETALVATRDLSARLDALSLAGKAIPDANLSKTTVAQGSTVTDIAKKVGPSVVGIRMTMTTNSRRYQANQNTSEGSGIIISADGYIMTNYHVVSYADPKAGNSKGTTLEVFLPDGRSAKARFVGGDSENDLAVVKIDLTLLPAAVLGNSAELQVGELAVAIGNPLGMEFAGSVTVGVVSALNRRIDGQEGSLSLIQTDAAINPGNSGGALVNAKGQVIGINSAKISQAGVEGLGFAIAVDDARPIVQSLILYGYVKNRPYLGITGQDITDVMAAMYDVPVGIYVTEIDPASGASKAGVRTGDIITGVAGKPVTTMAEINSMKKAYKAGDTVTFSLVRDTAKLTVNVTFTEAK